MKLRDKAKRFLGIDIAREKYAYAQDPRFGHISKARVADSWVKTTCGYCSVGCGMLIGVKDGKAVAARGNPEHPVNRGKLCPKGLSEHHILDAPGRATTPLLRKDGVLTPVSWDEAITTMVTRIRDIQTRYGPQALGVVGTGQLLTEETYTLGKLVQLGFGTSNNDGNTTLCMASAVSGYKLSFGSDGPPGSYEDLETADVILLIGANIADNHPILCERLQRNRQRTLIVADPRVTKTAMMADLYLPVKPRSDIALLNGMAHILIRDGLIDRAYIDAHAEGFADFATFVASFTPEHTSEVTGLSVEVIEHVANLYGNAKAAFIGWTMGVNHSTQGSVTVAAINNLALITGNIGRLGASPFSITGQCNAMGTRETGFTSSLPGYRKFDNVEDRQDLAAIWQIDADRIPAARGKAYPDIIEAAVSGSIKALWFVATNPAVSFPNYDLLEYAFKNVEFLVVQDGFHPTPTSAFADLVLPAAIWGEKEGTYTNSERRISKVNPVVAPPGEARSDFEIFLDIAEKLGLRDELYPGWTTTRDAYTEWQRVSAGRPCDYSEITWERIQREGGVQWGGKRLYTDGNFAFEGGRARLHNVPCEPFAEQPDKEYNLILNTGRTVEHWHTRTKTGSVEMLNGMVPNAWLEMNPTDAEQLRLRSHDRVTVVSRRNRVSQVELRITGIVAPGQVFMPFHFAEANSNLVTLGAFDPISREPNFKQCAVRVERSPLFKTTYPPLHQGTSPTTSALALRRANATNKLFSRRSSMANYKAFLKSGHPPTLFAAFLYFDFSFAVWVLNGAMGPFITQALHLTPAQTGLMIAVPTLAGALMRFPLGVISQYIGRKNAAIIEMSAIVIALLYGFFFVHSFHNVLAMGALLGLAGASFGVALSLGSGWFPKQYKGLAMGIAGAGNSGTALAALFAPRLAMHFGWQHVYGFAAAMMLLPLFVMVVFAKEPPDVAHQGLADHLKCLVENDGWYFNFLYIITFGGFIGLATFLPTFYVSQFHITNVQAGTLTVFATLIGSTTRVLGGWFADRIGGITTLSVVFLMAIGGLFGLTTAPSLALTTTLFMLCFAALGAGNGAIFQLVPLRWPVTTAIVGSMIGEVGALGGSILPIVLSQSKQHMGTYRTGFIAYAGLALLVLFMLRLVSRTWTKTWVGPGGRALTASGVAGRTAAEPVSETFPAEVAPGF